MLNLLGGLWVWDESGVYASPYVDGLNLHGKGLGVNYAYASQITIKFIGLPIVPQGFVQVISKSVVVTADTAPNTTWAQYIERTIEYIVLNHITSGVLEVTHNAVLFIQSNIPVPVESGTHEVRLKLVE